MAQSIPTNTQTKNLVDFATPTGNIYESVIIIAKRADQIALAEKKELSKKLEDFKNDQDNSMEEFTENHEQIEISKIYEKKPKPSLVAIAEFEQGELEYRIPEDEK